MDYSKILAQSIQVDAGPVSFGRFSHSLVNLEVLAAGVTIIVSRLSMTIETSKLC